MIPGHLESIFDKLTQALRQLGLYSISNDVVRTRYLSERFEYWNTRVEYLLDGNAEA